MRYMAKSYQMYALLYIVLVAGGCQEHLRVASKIVNNHENVDLIAMTTILSKYQTENNPFDEYNIKWRRYIGVASGSPRKPRVVELEYMLLPIKEEIAEMTKNTLYLNISTDLSDRNGAMYVSVGINNMSEKVEEAYDVYMGKMDGIWIVKNVRSLYKLHYD